MALSTSSADLISPRSLLHARRLSYWAASVYRLPRAIERADLEQEAWLALIRSAERGEPWGFRWKRAWWGMLGVIGAGDLGRRQRGGSIMRRVCWDDSLAESGGKLTLGEVTAAPEIGDHFLAMTLSMAAVEVLTPKQERIVAARWIEGRSWREITSELHLTSSRAARDAGHRALGRLRVRLDPAAPAPPPLAGWGRLPRSSPVPLDRFRAEMQALHAYHRRQWAASHPVRST